MVDEYKLSTQALQMLVDMTQLSLQLSLLSGVYGTKLAGSDLSETLVNARFKLENSELVPTSDTLKMLANVVKDLDKMAEQKVQELTTKSNVDTILK